MGTSAIDNQHPRFGFNEKRAFEGNLTNLALVGASFVRVAGLFEASVTARADAFVGVGQVNLILEGSNDAVNWTALSQLAPANYFTASGQQQILNPGDEPQTELERWQYLRVRSAIVAGAPTFTLLVNVTGIQGDSESFLLSDAFTRTASFVNGVRRIRPSGTKFVNVQAIASGVVLGGAASIDVVLQGTPHYTGSVSDVWQDLGSVSVTGNGSFVMSDVGDRLIDLAGFGSFRIRTEDVGGVSTSYNITVLTSLDSGDWILATEDSGAAGGGAIPGLSAALLEATFGVPGAEVGNTIVVPFQLLDADGAPVTTSEIIEVIVYDTSNAGDLDLAASATFSAVGGGAAVIAGVGTNRVVLTTSGTGSGTISILDAAVETVYITIVDPRGPKPIPRLIWQSEQATLAFV